MRPILSRPASPLPPDVTAVIDDNRAAIRSDVDAKYRAGLIEACARSGGNAAFWHILNALRNGPSRGGAAESIKYFGAGLQTKLLMTAQIVEGLEITMPRFGRWLRLTGFGNDKTMIKGFVAWAEHASGQGKVIGSVMENFDCEGRGGA